MTEEIVRMIFFGLFIFLIICLFAVIGFGIIALIKNENTSKNRGIIIEAIYQYRIKCNDPIVNYSDMEDYEKTLFRIGDWTYKKILPKEKYEIIKEYINKK